MPTSMQAHLHTNEHKYLGVAQKYGQQHNYNHHRSCTCNQCTYITINIWAYHVLK